MIDLPTPEEKSIEARRLLEGLNGQWVANRMGVSKAKVSKWRRGERIPSLDDLLRMPEATGRPLDPKLHERIFGSTTPDQASGKAPPESATGS